jgi:hypothetical protein
VHHDAVTIDGELNEVAAHGKEVYGRNRQAPIIVEEKCAVTEAAHENQLMLSMSGAYGLKVLRTKGLCNYLVDD